MCDSFLPPPGDKSIELDDLEIFKAKEVANALEKLDYFSLLDVRRSLEPGSEIIIFETEVEVGQRVKNGIQPIERIAAVFSQEDNDHPEVFVLREDFHEVPHLFLQEIEKPRRLCLFEEKYSEIKLRWTPVFFLRQIREWLAKTARGELHAEDQPLEPLLPGSPINLILAHDLFSDDIKEPIIIRKNETDYTITFIADWKKNVPFVNPKELEFAPIVIKGEAQPHGIICKKPVNIAELHEFLESASINLLDRLKTELWGILNNANEERKKELDSLEFLKGPSIHLPDHIIKESIKRKQEAENVRKRRLATKVIFILHLPKTRDGVEIEGTDIWAFMTNDSIQEIAIGIGIWEKDDIDEIAAIIEQDDTKRGESLNVQILNPVKTLSRENAAKLNDLESSRAKILLVGCGALGSQVFMNLIRAGFGEWVVVDSDLMLPHNFARHALPGVYTGISKSDALAEIANLTIDDKFVAESVIADILNPSKSAKKLECKYNEAQIIIDASAAIPVARHLAQDIESSARRISIFLNPTGKDALILAEDNDRKFQVDLLEMQYYRHVISTPELEDHLKQKVSSIRYARSCGDISSTISQDLVALHAAICSRKLHGILSKDTSAITLWKVNTEDMAVKSFDFSTYKVKKESHGEWTLYYDEFLENKVQQVRSERLPNETGGVLIGSFDMQRKIVYVVDTLLSPPDSIELPTSYIRGFVGLRYQIAEIEKRTAIMLSYVGEWHSHPDGFKATSSDDDKKAFGWLSDRMCIEGIPPLMMIAVKDGVSFYLGEM